MFNLESAFDKLLNLRVLSTFVSNAYVLTGNFNIKSILKPTNGGSNISYCTFFIFTILKGGK
jgi:hypothetical protein